MKKLFSTTLVAAIVGISSLGFSQSFEGFEQFAGTHDGSTGSTGFDGGTSATTLPWVGAGAIPSGGAFGGTPVSIDTTSPYAGSQALSWAGDTDAWALMAGDGSYGEVLPGTDGTVYAAFAVRVDSLDGDNTNNDIEIVRLGQGAGNRDIHIGVLDGELQIIERSSTAGSEITVSTTAFDGAGSNNWDDGEWRVLAIEATLDDAAANSSITLYNVTASGATALGTLSGFQAGGAAGITHYGYGAFAAVPTGSASMAITVDSVTIYDNSSIADTASFLSAVDSDYDFTSVSSVSEWSIYN